MPLVRLEVRNEYGLGDPELYRKPLRKEEPKAILNGVAVAGLVGILRQLGDLAEFAADVFHDLHEQITATAGRSRRMMTRIRNIESAIPSIEKVVKGQTSHIHFAYIAGSDWHTRIPHGQNLLLSSELPHFMMDSYEECHDPPRLFLLDKFDHSGTGACLKRYSDPSYFKRVWTASHTEGAKNDLKEKKVEKFKRKGSRFRVAEIQQAIYSACHHSRGENFASLSTDGCSISLENENISSPELRLNQEISSRSTSFGSKTKESFVEETSYADPQMMPDELGYRMSNPNSHGNDSGLSVSALQDEPSTEDSDDVSQPGSLHEQSIPRSSVTWEEKTEIVKPTGPSSYNDILVDRVQVVQEGIIVENSDSLELNSELTNAEHAKLEALVHEDIVFHSVKTPEHLSGVNHFDEVTSETDNYVDAPNTLDSEAETEVECRTKMEIQSISNTNSLGVESETGENQIISLQNADAHDAEAPASLDSAQTQNRTGNFLHLNSLNGSEHVQSPYAMKLVLNQDNLIPNNVGEINVPDISEIKDHHECTDGDLSSKSGASCGPTVESDEVASEPCTLASEPSILAHSFPTDASSMSSVQLWTNGDLFGVEPSKPPELGAMNKDNKNHISNSRGSKTGFSSCTMKSQMFVNEPGVTSDGAFPVVDPASVNFSAEMDVDSEFTLVSYVPQNSAGGQLSARRNLSVQMSTDVDIKQQSHMSVQHSLQNELLNNPHDSHSSSNDASLNKLEPTRTSEINGATPRDSYCIGSNAGPSQSSMGMSSSFSELAQRFLSNTIQRKVLSTTNSGNTSMESTKPEGYSCLNDNKEEPNIVASQTLYKQSIDEKATLKSEMEQTSSTQHYPEKGSPPLEYMKISFHPISGLENIRLKLDFSSGSLHEGNEDFVFPSFQLLQGPVETLPEACSESDDDTFCRSCPYSSEDLLSPCSYSNSEQWDQDESSEYFDHEFNDISQRFQSSTISRPMGSRQMDHADMHIPEAENFDVIVDNSKLPFHLGSMMELPGFDSVLSSIKQEGICHSFPENIATSVVPKDEAPPPPPLPPMQWTSKPSVTLEGYDDIKNNLNHLDGLQNLRISPSQKKEQNSPINSCIVHAILEHPKEEVVMSDIRLDQQKLNEQQRVTHSANHTEVDTREDLLQQIRNKKFSLRRTTISTPRHIPRHPTTNAANGNVNTILQKASAIRQAFVSSDDDNWSDA